MVWSLEGGSLTGWVQGSQIVTGALRGVPSWLKLGLLQILRRQQL